MATTVDAVYDDDDDNPQWDRRHQRRGRRKEDVQRHWPLYFAVAIQIATIVYGAATLSAEVRELQAQQVRATAQEERFMSLAMDLEKSVAMLNCRVGITCTK